MKRGWVEAEFEVLRRRFANEKTSVIADDLGKPEASVSMMAHRLGLKKSDEHRHATARAARQKVLAVKATTDELICRALRRPMRLNEIVEATGRGKKAVSSALSRMVDNCEVDITPSSDGRIYSLCRASPLLSVAWLNREAIPGGRTSVVHVCRGEE